MAKRKPSVKKAAWRYWEQRVFTLPVDSWCVDVVVGINCTGEKVWDYVRQGTTRCNRVTQKDWDVLQDQLKHWDTSNNEGMMIPFLGGFIVMLRAQRGFFCKFVGILTHEMVHTTQYLLRNRRVELSPETEEVHAYLTEYLVAASLKQVI